MKKSIVAALTFAAFTLAACGDEGEDSGRMDRDMIREKLGATAWECEDWQEVGESDAYCTFSTSPEKHAVFVTDDPELQAAMWFDYEPDTVAVIRGENWMFDCGSRDRYSVSDCEYLAGILGGEVQEP